MNLKRKQSRILSGKYQKSKDNISLEANTLKRKQNRKIKSLKVYVQLGANSLGNGFNKMSVAGHEAHIGSLLYILS